MNTTSLRRLALLLCVSLLPLATHADVGLPDLFAPGLVVQQGAPIPLWGTASPGENVRLSLNGQEQVTQSDAQGRWYASFQPMSASMNAFTLTVQGSNKVEIQPVWVGEVFICAGGEFWRSRGGEQGPKDTPPVSLFRAAEAASFVPASTLSGKWDDDPRLVSVQARRIGERLASTSQTPVGLIVLSSPTALESWIPRDLLENADVGQPIIEFYNKQGMDTRIQAVEADYATRLAAWNRAGEALPLEPEDRPTPTPPQPRDNAAPAVRFNALVAPLAGLPMRGLIWDHGEDSASNIHATQYGELLPIFFAGLRRNFNRPDLPIVIVQRRVERNRLYDDRAGAELREAQWNAQSDPRVSTVVTVDLGHSASPEMIADRVSESMVALLTGDPSKRYPTLDSVVAQGRGLILTFRDTGGGLVTPSGEPPRGLALQDGKRRWVWADAAIRGNQMMLTAPGVPAPAAARYAWQDRPEQGANLYGQNGRPVAPFRTDQAPNVTANVKKPDDNPRYTLQGQLYIENPRLPRVLIAGDSVAGGQVESMRTYLAGKANVIPGNSYAGGSFYTSAGALKDDTLARFLQERGPFDVIQFNMGIHEFASLSNPESAAPGYAERLRRVVHVFRENNPNGTLIWCSSTGTLRDGGVKRFPKYLTSATVFNKAAAQVMNEMGVLISDLFGYTQPKVSEYIGSDQIHIRNEKRPEVTEFLARNIIPALPAPLP